MRTAASASPETAYKPLSGGGPLEVRRPASASPAFSLDVTADAPCDQGFPAQSRPFDRGTVQLLQGAPHMDLSELQQPLSTAGWLRSGAVIALAGATGLGCCYLASKLTLVRTGELALVRSVSGDCRALGPGWHLIDTVTCDVVKASMTQPVVQLGNLTILRILPGELGKGQLNGQPLLLGPGVHLLNDPLFSFLGAVPATLPHINVAGTLHVITVGREELGLCLANAQGHFLGPGRHAICHPRFEFRGLSSAKSEYLCVGSKHRVFLAEGRLGLAWEGGRPLVLEPKDDRTPHCFDSPTFAFERSVPATQQVIVHGSVKVITVRQGFVGVSFRDGALEVMPPGRVVLSSVTHAFSGFLPTGQQTMQLEAVDGMTSDNVGLKFDAAVCVQIVDAKKAITALSTTAESARRANTSSSDAGFDSDTIWTAVCAKARLALSIIIGNQRLNRGDGREEEDGAHPPFQPGRGGLPHVPLGPAPAEARALAGADAKAFGGGGGGGDAGDPTPATSGPQKPATSFRTRIHDTFMANFAARMLEDCGVAVVDMSLEDVRITDKTLAEAMARGAVARADLAKATVERQIKVTQSEADKAAEILRAEGKAAATSVIAVAEANRVKLMDDTFSLLKSPVSQQRETLLAAGEVLRGSNSTLVLAGSPLDAAQMLGGGGGLSALVARSGAAALTPSARS